MRFLILNADYPEFLQWLYATHPGLENLSYDEQMKARVNSLFGLADFYSSNLRKLGHEAWDIYVNNESMQKAWAKEHGIKIPELEWAFILKKDILPWFIRVKSRKWFYKILSAQIKHYKPDVLLNQNMHFIDTFFLKKIRPYIRLLVGQHAATSLPSNDYNCYDLIVSSFPPTLNYFQERGIPTELHRLGFEPRVLSFLRNEDKVFDVTFIGSFHPVHRARRLFLETLCPKIPQIKIWGPDIHRYLPSDSPILKCYVGEAWGVEMYQIFANSKITLNHHGDIPSLYANNMRLYEATGVGTLLITDWKENLHELFETGKEIVVYRSVEECAELVQYYMTHDEERKTIARTGQKRTLQEHTYYNRMQEFVEIVRKFL